VNYNRPSASLLFILSYTTKEFLFTRLRSPRVVGEVILGEVETGGEEN